MAGKRVAAGSGAEAVSGAEKDGQNFFSTHISITIFSYFYTVLVFKNWCGTNTNLLARI